jgi:hypothetical protein
MAIVRVEEMGDASGWRIIWDASASEIVGTAAEALAALRARDQMLVESGRDMVVTQIEWFPRSTVGRTVVRVLTGARPRKE